MFLGCYQFIYCFKEWLLILTSWVVGFLFMAKCVLTFPTPTRTDEWIGCWVCDRRCWIGCCHWICACLWIEQFAHQSPCCFLNFCIFFRYISLNPFFFLIPLPSFFFPSFSLSVSVQLTKAHRQGHMVKVDWLDRLTFREIEMINEVSRFRWSLFPNTPFLYVIKTLTVYRRSYKIHLL